MTNNNEENLARIAGALETVLGQAPAPSENLTPLERIAYSLERFVQQGPPKLMAHYLSEEAGKSIEKAVDHRLANGDWGRGQASSRGRITTKYVKGMGIQAPVEEIDEMFGWGEKTFTQTEVNEIVAKENRKAQKKLDHLKTLLEDQAD